ncbi:MAG: preprotein translocase subunit SecG [Acidobacteriaceae bacterium]
MQNIHNILIYSLIGTTILLIISILLQQREGGLSTVFGGEGSVYRSRRGIAKGLHYFTIALAVVFIGLSMALLLYK